MKEGAKEEIKGLLTSQSDDEELHVSSSLEYRKLGFFRSPENRTVGLLYLGFLHASLVLLLFAVLFQHFHYHVGSQAEIYSGSFLLHQIMYHQAKEK
jgi:hypothetical protein